MKRARGFRFSLALLIITLLSACASFNYTIPQPDNPSLLYIKFCQGIIQGENPSEVKALKEGKFFSPDVGKIWLLICLSNLEGHHIMQWKWYAPDKSLSADSGEFAINPDGEFHRLAYIWDYLIIEGLPAEKTLGKWTVALFLDGKLITTSHFNISK